jgi:23S rRNA pseudouridine1911/1915/1917 synthase
VPKPKNIELNDGEIVIPILYEDRSVIAIDKPGGWMLAPDSWDQTGRNLQLALNSSIGAGDFWARSRNLKYLRFVHRLDAETTGITLFAKSPGALHAYSELFEERRVEKFYLAVVHGVPKQTDWTCDLPLRPDPSHKGRMLTTPARGRLPLIPSFSPTGGEGARRADEGAATPETAALEKDAKTHFRVLQKSSKTALIEAQPTTGRTHQIRAHLAAAGHPVLGDPLYGPDAAAASKGRQRLALRAVKLSFRDPFQKRTIYIQASAEDFLKEFGFGHNPGIAKPEGSNPKSLVPRM